jgi:hypothetical protein
MMNERIQKLAEQANAWYPDGYPSGEGGDAAWQNLVIFDKEDLVKFAELIVKECIYTLQLKIVRNGNTPENLRSREHIRDLGEKFGIEFPMDYYPDRNKHFGVES